MLKAPVNAYPVAIDPKSTAIQSFAASSSPLDRILPKSVAKHHVMRRMLSKLLDHLQEA